MQLNTDQLRLKALWLIQTPGQKSWLPTRTDHGGILECSMVHIVFANQLSRIRISTSTWLDCFILWIIHQLSKMLGTKFELSDDEKDEEVLQNKSGHTMGFDQSLPTGVLASLVGSYSENAWTRVRIGLFSSKLYPSSLHSCLPSICYLSLFPNLFVCRNGFRQTRSL